MMSPKEKAERFRALHVPGRPLVLFNIWDPGSAKAVAAAGAPAIATGSWSVANANGYADGERIPLDLAIGNLFRIVQAVGVPVTVDIESGYGKTPAAVGQAIDRTIQAGAIGCNLEDSFPENGELREIAEQVERIRYARKAADEVNASYFINARTDVFFQASTREHDDATLAAALARARAYAHAGANGLFVPGLTDETLIARLTAASPLPVNIMVGEKTPSLTKLTQLGVARVSHGPNPYLAAMSALQKAARDAAIDAAIAV
jgi:2-methylisocitrate lyase-like PEP mutase family enzyme